MPTPSKNPPPQSPRLPHSAPRAFTLMEILVVVVIITLLIAILIPVLSKARERAKGSATAATINSIATALEAYKSFLSQYPTNDDSEYGNPGTYGFNILARGLTGYQDAAGDGADGFGFRTNPLNLSNANGVNAKGQVYGPYLTPTAKNYRAYKTLADFPNPVSPASAPGGYTEFDPNNQGFVDAWGQPIFYFASRSGGSTTPFGRNWNNGNSVGPCLFLSTNPDLAANTITIASAPSVTLTPAAPKVIKYTLNGVDVFSRLVPYVPATAWNTSPTTGTPWGCSLAPGGSDIDCPTAALKGDWRYPATAGFAPTFKFRKLIGQTDPSISQSVALQTTDRIVGRNTFLLVSAGPDNQYYTGDEIINESAR